jgi:ABC-type lipoprotein export system ATPase subunit
VEAIEKPKRYPVGSEWRRWDLHVHTPSSALENAFGSWDEYLVRLSAEGGIAVMGATDYCSIEGYKRLLSERQAGRLKNIETIIPNIEFRTLPTTEEGKGVNFHLLISPDADDHVEQIEAALNALQVHINGSKYSCTTADLRRLGKTKTGTECDANFGEGVNQFKPNFDDLRNWYGEQKWLRENSIVVVANKSTDGASGLKESGVLLKRQDHYRFSHAIFSGNPKDREYFLGEGVDPPDKVKRDYGSVKPCIHGSDAHCEAKMFKPDMDRFCWIKADPTFDGLRQILCEPRLRVHIGKEAPTTCDKSKAIAAASFRDAGSWFTQPEVQLNPGLVAIVGEKGSGKTALVDAIAITCSGQQFANQNASFLSKAKQYLGQSKAAVTWANGQSSWHKLVDPQRDDPSRVRYLSQDFVEELCSKDHSGTELIKQIEEVIFSHIDEGDQAEAPDFDTLRDLKTAPFVEQRRDLTERMSRLNAEVVDFEKRIEQVPTKKKVRDGKAAELLGLQKQITEIPTSVDKTLADGLASDRALRRAATVAIAERTKAVASLNNLAARIKTKNIELAAWVTELLADLADAGVLSQAAPPFTLEVPVAVENAIASKIEQLLNELKGLKGDANAATPTGTSLADIDVRIAKSESALKVAEVAVQRVAELQKQESKLAQELEALKKEIDRIETKDTEQLTKRQEERWSLYKKYLDELAKEKAELESLYDPITSLLTGEASDAAKKFEFSVQQSRDIDAWVKQGQAMLDGRRRNRVTGSDFRNSVEALLKTAWQTSDVGSIKTALEDLHKDLKAGDGVDSQLLSHATRVMLYDWLYGFDKIELTYGLSYEGNELSVLSPGTRGIVLLILYLQIDRHDRRPLIIDQPEANLDNGSIYDALVPFIRRAKQERQIILVTHNPNLVVATDADQVIVASSHKEPGARHPKITYKSGSLEHTARPQGIRELVCKLLEGGRDAFEIRERRYSNTAGI